MPYGSLSLVFALEIPLDFIPFPVSLSLLGLPDKCFDLSTCWAPASPASFSLLPSCPLKPPHPNGRDRSRPAPGTHGIAAPVRRCKDINPAGLKGRKGISISNLKEISNQEW